MKKQSSIFICGILFAVVFLSGCDSSYGRYEDSELYVAGNFSYSAEQVKEIEIDWTGGSIEIQQGEKEFSAMESSRIRSSEQKMHHYLEGNILKIEYCASGYKGDIH